MRILISYVMFTTIAFCIFLQPGYAQTKPVRGKVVDSKDGAPIAGATVRVLNSKSVTVTNADGAFELKSPENATTLIITFVGYKTLEAPIASDLSNLKLEDVGSQSLSEVVVVGYGTKIKKDITSSISKVTGKEFENLPLPSFEQALQGRASGVFINSGSGKLGRD